jgi:hypothetical protein
MLRHFWKLFFSVSRDFLAVFAFTQVEQEKKTSVHCSSLTPVMKLFSAKWTIKFAVAGDTICFLKNMHHYCPILFNVVLNVCICLTLQDIKP